MWSRHEVLLALNATLFAPSRAPTNVRAAALLARASLLLLLAQLPLALASALYARSSEQCVVPFELLSLRVSFRSWLGASAVADAAEPAALLLASTVAWALRSDALALAACKLPMSFDAPNVLAAWVAAGALLLLTTADATRASGCGTMVAYAMLRLGLATAWACLARGTLPSPAALMVGARRVLSLRPPPKDTRKKRRHFDVNSARALRVAMDNHRR
jgi:hypothetical protein